MTNETFENNSEKLSFSQKLELVKDLFQAAENRNNYAISLAGDFDTFAESFGHIPEHRDEYERLSQIFSNLRENVDREIVDKQEFAEQLIEGGETELVNRFMRMFQVTRPSVPLRDKVRRFLKGEND